MPAVELLARLSLPAYLFKHGAYETSDMRRAAGRRMRRDECFPPLAHRIFGERQDRLGQLGQHRAGQGRAGQGLGMDSYGLVESTDWLVGPFRKCS